MSIAQSPDTLKRQMQELVGQLDGFVRQAVHDGRAIHEVERGIWRRILALGHTALGQFFDLQGTGDLGPTLELPDDLRMAQRYARTALGRERPVTPVILCGPDEVDAYRAAGARHFIRRVGELPALARTVGA